MGHGGEASSGNLSRLIWGQKWGGALEKPVHHMSPPVMKASILALVFSVYLNSGNSVNCLPDLHPK